MLSDADVDRHGDAPAEKDGILQRDLRVQGRVSVGEDRAGMNARLCYDGKTVDIEVDDPPPMEVRLPTFDHQTMARGWRVLVLHDSAEGCAVYADPMQLTATRPVQ